MDINTLQNNIANAIHDDQDTSTWCVTTYDQEHKVFIGFDSRKPPAEDDYPLVRVWKTGKTSGYDLDRQDHVISVLCGIYVEAEKVLARDRITQYQSTDDIETFRKYVEAATTAAIASPYFIASMEIEYEAIEFYPFLLANMELRITKDYSQGDDVLA